MATTRDDVGDRVRRAAEGFAARVRAVPGSAWSTPTPCSEWDVRALVNHVAMELRWISAPIFCPFWRTAESAI